MKRHYQVQTTQTMYIIEKGVFTGMMYPFERKLPDRVGYTLPSTCSALAPFQVWYHPNVCPLTEMFTSHVSWSYITLNLQVVGTTEFNNYKSEGRKEPHAECGSDKSITWSHYLRGKGRHSRVRLQQKQRPCESEICDIRKLKSGSEKGSQ